MTTAAIQNLAVSKANNVNQGIITVRDLVLDAKNFDTEEAILFMIVANQALNGYAQLKLLEYLIND